MTIAVRPWVREASRPLSLSLRLLLAATVALAAFLGVTGLVLDNAFRDSARQAQRDRLQGNIYALLSAATLDGEQLILPDVLPEPRFSRPESGLYMFIRGDDFEWNSPSALGIRPTLSVDTLPGQTLFEASVPSSTGTLTILSLGSAWERNEGDPVWFTFHAAEDQTALEAQVSSFRRSLWGWLGGAALLLLVVQWLVLRWSLRPLRELGEDIRAVEAGTRDQLGGRYPAELQQVAGNLNAFIRSERSQLERYRNSLADLAHSLKTPLAVLRSGISSSESPDRKLLDDQVDRMDEIVAYQLRRAGTSGRRVMVQPVAVQPKAKSVLEALGKVFSDKSVDWTLEASDQDRFYGDSGDLLELLGNLCENAFKWCRSQVRVRVASESDAALRQPGLRLAVEDDGPGIADEQVDEVLARGKRADEEVPGHGIGLAVVKDIVEAYGGTIAMERSSLGGARVALHFPPQ